VKKYLTILVLFLIVGGCSQKSPQSEADQLFKEAVQLTEDYKFEEARAKFIKLSELEPNEPGGYFGLGLIYEKQFLFYDALEVYITIKNTRPTFTPALEGCWRLYNYFDLYDEALQLAGAYNKVQPEQPESKIMLARVFINGSTPKRAESFLDTALIMGGNVNIIDLIRAQYYISVQKADSAELYYQSGLSVSDPAPEVLMEAAYYLEKKGLIDSAVVMSRKAMNQKIDYSIWYDHYQLAIRNQYFNEAGQVIKKFKEAHIPEEAVTTLEALYHYAAGNFTPSRHYLDKMVSYAQKTMSFLMYEIEIRGHYGDEITLMQNYDVIQDLMKGKDSEPEYAELMVYLSSMLYTDVMIDMSGVTKIEEVSTKYYSKPDYYLRNAYLYYRTGQQDEFNTKVDNVLNSHERHPNWLTGLGDIYKDQSLQRYEDAEKLYKDALDIDKWYRPAFAGYVDMFRLSNRFGKAIELFGKYPHFEENYPELAILKALCFIENNKTEEGINLFLNKIGYLKGNLGWFKKMLKALYHTSNASDKVRFADWLSDNEQENTEALTLASDIYCETKNYEKAKQIAEKALSLDTENLTASAMKARAIYYLGNVDEAIRLLKENNEKDKSHIENNMYLSLIMALEGIEPNNAENMARKAVFDSYSAFKPWLNLSKVYYNTGRFDLARGEAAKLSRSHKDDPEQPEAVFQLGMALYMESNEEAAEKLQEAIDLGLRGESLTIAKETLKKI